MPARKKELPPLEDLLEAAQHHRSIRSLAEAIGWVPNSLQTRLEREGWKKRIAAALAAPVPDQPEEAEEVSREEILEQQVKELQSRERLHRRDEVLEQRILDSIRLAVETRKSGYSPQVIPKSHRKSDQHEFLLLWSDPHAGEMVSEEETNGINSYDWSTMLKRHDRLREGVFSYLENRPYPVRKLHVAALGDMVGGDIHEELRETNEFPIAEVAVQFGMDGAEWLDSLAKPFESTSVVGVIGNHGRLTRKPQAKRAYSNWDRVAYRVMAERLRNDSRFEFQIPKATMWPFLVARNFRVLAWHGDGVRSSMPGVPWGGVTRRASALQNQYTQAGQPIYLFVVGHFHTPNLVSSAAGWIAMNSSIKGPDEYSLKAFGSGSAPQQLLLTLHPKHGLTDCSVIDLEDTKVPVVA